METMHINNSFQKLGYSISTCNCDVETTVLGFTEANNIFQWKESHCQSMGNPHTKTELVPLLMNLWSTDSGRIATYILTATRQILHFGYAPVNLNSMIYTYRWFGRQLLIQGIFSPLIYQEQEVAEKETNHSDGCFIRTTDSQHVSAPSSRHHCLWHFKQHGDHFKTTRQGLLWKHKHAAFTQSTNENYEGMGDLGTETYTKTHTLTPDHVRSRRLFQSFWISILETF